MRTKKIIKVQFEHNDFPGQRNYYLTKKRKHGTKIKFVGGGSEGGGKWDK